MKYSNIQYARAVLESLKDKSPSKRREVLKNFLAVLRKNRDAGRLNRILKEVERESLKGAGVKKVAVESAVELSRKTKREIEEILGRKIVMREKINPAMLAGVKITVDDELLIDATASRQLSQMFLKK